jgi:Flp pilus assembly protein TadG
MMSPYRRLKKETRGQAMLETALMLPLLLEIVFNTVNFGYFFLIALNVTAAPHSGALYSILGASTPIENGGATLADPGPPDNTTYQLTVSGLTLGDLTGSVRGGESAGVQVCTAKSGTSGNGAALISVCKQYNSSPTYTPDPDPEAPNFVLNRVDVTYTFKPLLDQRLFNLILLAAPVCSGSGGVTCTFHRQVSMRAMD